MSSSAVAKAYVVTLPLNSNRMYAIDIPEFCLLARDDFLDAAKSAHEIYDLIQCENCAYFGSTCVQGKPTLKAEEVS